MDAPVRCHMVRGAVGDHRPTDHRHPALTHRRGDRLEPRPAAHSRHTGDATGMTVDIDRRGSLYRASHIFRARLRLVSGAGGETHKRACCQHITPRHRGPARRFAQPRVAELVAPARMVVAGDTPGTNAWRSFRGASPLLGSLKCGGSCSDICCGWQAAIGIKSAAPLRQGRSAEGYALDFAHLGGGFGRNFFDIACRAVSRDSGPAL